MINANHYRLYPATLLLWLLVLLAHGAQAQSLAPLSFQHITASEGLSQNSVQALLQDQQGYLWVGTQDGLNRFDGYGFVHYRQGFASGAADDHTRHPGLSSSTVWTLYEDSAGTLWAGTVDGLNRFDADSSSFRHYRHLPDDPQSLSHLTVRAIAEDAQQRLWVGTSRGGLNLLDAGQQHFSHFRHDPGDPYSLSSDRIDRIVLAPDGALWVSTEDAGVNRFDPQSGRAERFRHDPGNPSSLSSDNTTALMIDSEGMVWVGTDDAGLNRLDPRTGVVQRFRHDPADPFSLSFDSIRALYEDSQGRIWIGHYLGGGLDLYERSSNRFLQSRHQPGVPDSLNNDHVLAILEDNSGILWFGTHVGGLNKYDARRDRFQHVQHSWWNANSLSDNTVRAFLQQGQTLFIGTENGLNVLDLESAIFSHIFRDPENPSGSLPHNVVRSMVADGNGHIWLATHGGLARMHIATQQFTHYLHDPTDPHSLSDNVVWRVFIDSHGDLWVGTRDALNRFDPETGQAEHFLPDADDPYSIAGDRIIAIFEDSRGDLWFSTVAAGVNRFDRDTGRFTRHLHNPEQPGSISDSTIFAISEDDSGALWFGTRAGINRLDPETGEFRAYTEADGLPNNVVYGILSDDDNRFWLSTNRGLARFDPHRGEVLSFGRTDGLQDDEFNNGAYYRAPSGLMYFGGVNGFNVFDPAAIELSDFHPPVVITDFQVLGNSRQVANNTTITLPHDENHLSFEFAALDFSAPDSLLYQYRLMGFDPTWVDAGQHRYANYTNLPPGRYQFQVRGTNADGLWSPHEALLVVNIQPAYWQTRWFQLLLLTITLLLVASAHLYRTRQVRLRNAELAALVAARTSELERINASLSREVMQRKRAEEEIRRIAYHDPLTELPNRRLFTAIAEQSLRSAARSNRGLALCFIDLDDFKRINDQWGHESGDQVLRETAQRIRAVIRTGDIAARIGGDEFVLLLDDVASPEIAALVASKVTTALAPGIVIADAESGTERTVHSGVSIGIALYPQHGDSLQALLRAADQAMYRAKQRPGADPELASGSG